MSRRKGNPTAGGHRPAPVTGLPGEPLLVVADAVDEPAAPVDEPADDRASTVDGDEAPADERSAGEGNGSSDRSPDVAPPVDEADEVPPVDEADEVAPPPTEGVALEPGEPPLEVVPFEGVSADLAARAVEPVAETDWSVDDTHETARTTPMVGPAPVTPDVTPEVVVAPAARRDAIRQRLVVLPADAQANQLRTPGRRPRVRKVTRVLRHVDPWSTFKVGLLFSAIAYLITLTSGVLLWQVADATGTLANVERWFTQFGWETFEFDGSAIFHNAWVIGLFGVVATTGLLVLLATLFNLVSDIIGGIRMTVLEEEVVERTITSTRRFRVRERASTIETVTPPAEDWEVDDGPPATPPAADDRAWSVD